MSKIVFYTIISMVFALGCIGSANAIFLTERDTLKGIEKLQVIVENLASDIERDGLQRDLIQTDLELRLRQARIEVVDHLFMDYL